MGKVRTQARTISQATPHRTADKRRVAPTPRIDEVIEWVVLTGKPSRDALSMIEAAVVSAANPSIVRSFDILLPTVVITLLPPAAVPRAMVSPEMNITHRGTSNSEMRPPAKRAKVMIPMSSGRRWCRG